METGLSPKMLLRSVALMAAHFSISGLFTKVRELFPKKHENSLPGS
jgi:hypothetical protein